MSRPVFSTRRLFRRALILAHRFVFGSLLAGLLLILALLYGGLIYAKHKLTQGIDAGEMTVRAQGLRVGWDLCLRVDSLQMGSPDFTAAGNGVRLRPVLAKNFWAVFPSLKLSIGSLDLKLHGRERSDTGQAKAPTFPELRWPMPWSVDITHLAVHGGGREQVVLSDLQIATRGMLGIKAKATVKAGEWGETLPASLQAGVKCEVSARWKGPELGYRAHIRTVQGDSLMLRGRRQREDLRQAKDSLALACARPSLYAPESLAQALAPYHDFMLSMRLDTRKRVTYAAQVSLRADTLPLLGGSNISATLRGGLSRAWFGFDLQTFAGGKALVQGELPFQKLEAHDTSVSALGRLRPARASFSAAMHDLHLNIGDKKLPADGQLRDGVFAPGLVTARLLTAAGSEMHLAFHLRKAWLLAFDGAISSNEPWVHGWTDTNITFASMRAKGQVKTGLNGVQVQVQAMARQVEAYRAQADSLRVYARISTSDLTLDSARIFHGGYLWRGHGEVIWKKRGRFLEEGVDLQFTAANPELGRGHFRMPRRGQLEAVAENVAAHASPYVPLRFLAPYAPRVTGEFTWNQLRQDGKVHADLGGLHANRKLAARLDAHWTAQELVLKNLTVSSEGMQSRLTGQVHLGGKPFYAVYLARLPDIRALRLSTQSLDLADWIQRFLPASPLLAGELNGDVEFTPEEGLRGGLDLARLKVKGQPEAFEFGDLHLKGHGDTLALALTTHSKTEPFFNGRLHLRALRPLTLEPDFLIDITLRDSMHLAARAHVDRNRTLRGALDLVGAVELPAGVGALRQVHWLTAFEWPLNKGISGLRGESRTFRGVFVPAGWPQQTFAGRLHAAEGVIYLDSLQLRDPEGKTLNAEARYALGASPELQFQVQGDALALSYKGQRLLQLRRLAVKGGLKKGAFDLSAQASQAEFEYRKGAILAQGKVEGLAVDFKQPSAALEGASAPSQIRLKGTLAQSLFRHKIGARELTGFLRNLLRIGRSKPSGKTGTHDQASGAGSNGGASGGGKSRPLELAVQFDTKGQDNRIETEVGRLNFAGDINAKGVYPYLLLNGAVTSLKGGEIGQKSQAYELRDLELKWQNAPPQEGTIALEGDKKLKIDCDPQTQKTCHVTIRFEGRFDEAKFSYDTDCGGEEGEAIKPTAIINSVARGCYTGDLTGGDNEGDYGKTFVNLITPYVNENLTRAIHKGSAGWIKNANVTGLTQLVEGENAQIETDEPVALNLESKEKYRVRLLGRGGYFPASKQSSTYDLKVVAEWRPPIDQWVSDSTWKTRLKDKVTVDAGIESRPEERNTDVERQVRRQVGLKYKHQFWKFW